MKYEIEDLGVQAYGDLWMSARHGRNPKNGHEVGILPMSLGGFMVVDMVDRTSVHVRPELDIANGSWDAVGQAPDGRIYLTGVFTARKTLPLFCWNWEGRKAAVVAELPGLSFFSLDVAPDGRVYLPEYGQNTLLRFDPASGKVENLGDFREFATNIHNVYCGADGWAYLTCIDYAKAGQSGVAAYDPATNRKTRVKPACGPAAAWPVQWGGITQDADGHVVVPVDRWGRSYWLELWEGGLRDISQADVRLTRNNSPLAFRDGSYVSGVQGKTVTVHDSARGSASFEINREDSPLRIFSVYGGGGRIWGGTFMPLTLFSYDPAAGKTEFYGNPTPTDGEIYSMAFSAGKLFMASYYGGFLTRFDPAKPIKRDQSLSANPAPLGRMKEEGLDLQRPHGNAIDAKGRIFFAAMGGYGCEDSGISRIDPATEQVTRWIYPNTTFGSMVYLPTLDQLLVSEMRKGEEAIRFTFVDPETGKIVDDRPVIQDRDGITSWLTDGGDWVYGMHAYRATLFAYSLKERKIVKKLPEMGLGDNCYNCMVFGPDGRIWGLTVDCVFAAERDLSRFEKLADYPDHAGRHGNRFGLCAGPDGHVYFPNGTHLMRIRRVG